MKKIILNTSRGSFLIDTTVIIRVEASSNYSKVFFSDGKMLLTAKLLCWFEEQLKHESFTRLHRSHLINNRYLQLQKCSGKAVELLNGKTVPVSRRRKKRYCKNWRQPAPCYFPYAAIKTRLYTIRNTQYYQEDLNSHYEIIILLAFLHQDIFTMQEE